MHRSKHTRMIFVVSPDDRFIFIQINYLRSSFSLFQAQLSSARTIDKADAASGDQIAFGFRMLHKFLTLSASLWWSLLLLINFGRFRYRLGVSRSYPLFDNIRMSKSKSRKKINNYVIRLDEPLGQGAYAKVFKAHDEHSQCQYAVKVIQRAMMEADQYTAKAIKLEISIHQSLIHPNIVRVIDIVQTPNNYYIFQQYCSGGNLRKLLSSQPQNRLTEADALHCLRCICAAFQPIFEKGVIHRDLKPENIVIEGDQLKITDFGFAKALASSRQMTRTVIGTPLYMSPQILEKQPYNSKCDVWSVGVIFFELLFGHHPWKGKNLKDLLKNIRDHKEVAFPEDIEVSELTKSLLVQCLQYEEADRLSWIELYEHQIWDASFHSIASQWRGGYTRAEEKLSQLRANCEVELLIGVFLRVRTPALNFLQFSAIIKSLLGDELEEKEIGMMYQLFDKDSNGVIDLAEFVGSLSQCPERVLQLLNHLVSGGHYYEQLSREERFMYLCQGEEQWVRRQAFALISNMKY